MDKTFIIGSILIGVLSGYFLRYFWAKLEINSAERKLEAILEKAEEKKKEAILEAKEKAIGLIEEAKKEAERNMRELKELERDLRNRQGIFEKKLIGLEEKRAQIEKESELISETKERTKKLHEEAVGTLQKIAGLTTEEAKQELFEALEKKFAGFCQIASIS